MPVIAPDKPLYASPNAVTYHVEFVLFGENGDALLVDRGNRLRCATVEFHQRRRGVQVNGDPTPEVLQNGLRTEFGMHFVGQAGGGGWLERRRQLGDDKQQHLPPVLVERQ